MKEKLSQLLDELNEVFIETVRETLTKKIPKAEKKATLSHCWSQNRGIQRQFSENICSEDDLRSRICGTFVVKFLACRIFEHLKNGIIAHF